MPLPQDTVNRDAIFLGLMYAVLVVAVTGLAVVSLMHRTSRATDDMTHVWVACVGATPWLVAAAVAAWQARSGQSAPWLPAAVVLLVCWLVACGLVVGAGSTAVTWYVVPLMCIGVLAALPLVMVGQVAHRAAASNGPGAIGGAGFSQTAPGAEVGRQQTTDGGMDRAGNTNREDPASP